MPYVHVPSGYALDASTEVTLHTGSGTDTQTDLYRGRGSPVRNDGGDTVFVYDDSGILMVEDPY